MYHALQRSRAKPKDNDVAVGTTTPARKQGNDLADKAATNAKTAQRNEQRHILGLLNRRWVHVKHMTKLIQDMQLDIVAATRQRRDAIVQEANMTTTHRRKLQEVSYPSMYPQAERRRLRRRTQTWLTKGTAGWQHALAEWIHKWEWTLDHDEGTTCISWLELMIGFELDTQQQVPHPQQAQLDAGNTLLQRLPLGKLVAHFMQTVRNVLEVLFTSDARRLMHAAKGPHTETRLQGLAITGSWECIAGCPNWSTDLSMQVHLTLLRQRGVEPRQPSGLALGPWLLRPQPINRKGQPCWRRALLGMLQGQATTTDVHMRAHTQGYHAGCQKCGSTMIFPDKPTAIGTAPPLIKCCSCLTKIRIMGMRCRTCDQRVRRCKCNVMQMRARQTTTARWIKPEGPTTAKVHHVGRGDQTRVDLFCNRSSRRSP